jgi:hypothetical protein
VKSTILLSFFLIGIAGFSQSYCSDLPENPPQARYALEPIKKYPLAVIKQWPPLACIPQTSTASPLAQRLINAARGVRNTAFAARTAAVCLGGAALCYELFKSDDAPDNVKQFCYDQAGRNNFKVKALKGQSRTGLMTLFNTLYVPADPHKRGLKETLEKQLSLENERKQYVTTYPEHEYLPAKLKYEIEDTTDDLNLFKGILDHEITHLNNYDSYREPLLISATCTIMGASWLKMRSKLEQSFTQHAPHAPNTLKGAALIGRRWFIKLVIPTALYVGTYFATRQLIKKTIEAQADAGVRDDIDVLTQMEKMFRARAEWKSDSYIEQLATEFFDSHPSDESRADYFAQRIENLKNSTSKRIL